ncbi:hypothetical protein [Streptomyces sp. NBC_01244]|uniref:hypothetical protein n=1 Tax=Streptomyces sp. NBC_01244 TaxID=2903797 RepID=UPI002E120912|nr:hypothetical protein OG247_04430 [Streptomyces sp. NBC_01244]
MHTFTVDAPDVSTAWLEACERLASLPKSRAFHTVVRIANPLQENSGLRSELDRRRAARTDPLYPIDTVVNTLFPVQLAATCATHEELAERYRALYPRLRRVRRNAHGTYFGRLIAYPGADKKSEPVDQIARVISRMESLRKTARWSAVYEAGTAHVLDTEAAYEDDPPESAPETEAVIRAAALDTQPRDFPCLSHCSFQMDASTDSVHLAAYYRSHYMFERAYGNYLALGHLCEWVARQTGLKPGTLTVMAGSARLDCTKTELGHLQAATANAPLFDLGA